ncbi:FAD-dependent oxidoreductase [Desulfobacterales bacterium HSG2]|nr:FAD-dependent oxidoreductase [Desulfobacterales bacterium HSG2]
MKYVIIGNGAAGIHAAEAIRESDSEGSITMIGDETINPYCRPMISLLLEGAIQPDKLPIRGSDFYDNLKIRPVLGKRVSGIDVDNKIVFIQNGERNLRSVLAHLLDKLMSVTGVKPDPVKAGNSETAFTYDKLLIATGADPRPVKVGGQDLENIFYMRTETHVREISEAVPNVRNALVLGGGPVGFKAAYGLMQCNINVTIIEREDRLFPLRADETASGMILEEVSAHDLKVKLGTEVTSFEGTRKVESARLSDGTEIPCDMAVICIGVLPALSFVPRDKIQVDLGILINPQMETTAPGIFAAGDVAEMTDIARKTPWVNAIWPEATAQGRIAGTNMAGRRSVEYKGSLGRNTIHIFGLDLMTGGLINPPSDDPQYEILSHSDPRLKTYRKLVFREDKLVGMIMVNSVEQGGVLLSLIQSETPFRVPKELLLEPSFNYGQLLT